MKTILTIYNTDNDRRIFITANGLTVVFFEEPDNFKESKAVAKLNDMEFNKLLYSFKVIVLVPSNDTMELKKELEDNGCTVRVQYSIDK